MTDPQKETVVLYPEGRIDSNNAKSFEAEIAGALKQHPGAALTLDLDRLQYISSAGLRVLLAVSRSGTPLSLRGVSPEVYDILDMTGFTSFLAVERKLRCIDLEGCELIGRGATASVYRIDPDTIVKVYEIPDALDMIKNEQRRAKQAFLKGIPTAISYDAVRVGESYGSVFELVNAKTFVDLLRAEPERLEELARRHAEVIRTIHGIEAEPGELPDCREIFSRYLDEIGDAAPEELRRRLKERFAAMPEDLHMIHGDIHMKNVMLSGGEALLIDMETLSVGNPVFDFANLFVAYRAFNEDDPMNSAEFIGLSMETCDRLMDLTLDFCLGPMDEARRRDTVKRIMAVGYVRFLYLVAVMRFGGEERIALRIRHTVEHLYELLGELEGFAI